MTNENDSSDNSVLDNFRMYEKMHPKIVNLQKEIQDHINDKKNLMNDLNNFKKDRTMYITELDQLKNKISSLQSQIKAQQEKVTTDRLHSSTTKIIFILYKKLYKIEDITANDILNNLFKLAKEHGMEGFLKEKYTESLLTSFNDLNKKTTQKNSK